MKQTGLLIALATVFAVCGVAAAQTPTPPPPKVDARAAEEPADLEARLQEAQKSLEAAAAEVAALASEKAGLAAEAMKRRAIIGVQLDAASGKDGVRVREVSPGGPAADAGMRPGDVIVAVDGQDVRGKSTEEVARLLRQAEPESKLKLRIVRDGKPQELEVVPRRHTWLFGRRTGPRAPDFDFDFDRAHWGRGLRHMELTTLTPELGRYFGTDKGVLVIRAPDDEVYKLQDGDVILSIDGREPTSSSHATRILRSYQPGEKLNLRVMRDRKALNLEIELPKARERGSREEARRQRVQRGGGQSI